MCHVNGRSLNPRIILAAGLYLFPSKGGLLILLFISLGVSNTDKSPRDFYQIKSNPANFIFPPLEGTRKGKKQRRDLVLEL